MALTSDEVRHVALLTRIRLTEQEVELYRSQMDDILEHFQMLQELDTDQVTPTSHSVPLDTVMRDDETKPCLDKEDVLSNAPRREGDYFRVKAVLE